MELFTEAGAALLARWVHILAGITWIGLLYYFNFVQVPFFAAAQAEVRTAAISRLVPLALAWFRYAALLTLLAGLGIFIINIDNAGWTNWDELVTSEYGLKIVTGMTLGTIMFLNVWGVIWPKQKIVIASARAVSEGGSADPAAADAGRRALLASRTNVVLSVPMLFFMAVASHLSLFDPSFVSDMEKLWYLIIGGAIVLIVQLNALVGKTGIAKWPLETIWRVILSGFGLWAVIYVVLSWLTRSA